MIYNLSPYEEVVYLHIKNETFEHYKSIHFNNPEMRKRISKALLTLKNLNYIKFDGKSYRA